MDFKEEDLIRNPRGEISQAVRDKDTERCLIKTAEIHGHFCLGSALGVMAAVWGLNQLGGDSTSSAGMEDLTAVVEVNSCFADGIQAVSGCTLGNNSLVYRDLGKTAVTFARRGEKTGVRIRVRPEFRALIEREVPEFFQLFDRVVRKHEGSPEEMEAFKQKGREASFALVRLPFEDVLAAEEVPVDLPGYAPVVESIVCDGCGEETMNTKVVMRGDSSLCRVCAGVDYCQVDGQGIVTKA